MKKNLRGAGVYLLILVLAVAAISFIMEEPKPKEVTYADVIDYFYANEVRTFSLEGSKLELTLYNGKTIQYIVPYLSLFMEDIRPVLEKQRAEVVATPIQDYNIKAPKETPWWAALIPYVVMFGLIIALWYFMMRQAGGGNKAMSFGKARTRFQPDHQKRITFADVAGAASWIKSPLAREGSQTVCSVAGPLARHGPAQKAHATWCCAALIEPGVRFPHHRRPRAPTRATRRPPSAAANRPAPGCALSSAPAPSRRQEPAIARLGHPPLSGRERNSVDLRHRRARVAVALPGQAAVLEGD